jgi:hypothetical protein
MAPLMVLRDRDVGRIADQQDDLAVVVVDLAVGVAGMVLEVVVVGEEDPGDRRIAQMQMVEGEHAALGQAVPELIEARQHDAQPGPPALAERDDDAVGLFELLRLLAPAQAPIGPDPLVLRPEDQGRQDHEARKPLQDRVEGWAEQGLHQSIR